MNAYDALRRLFEGFGNAPAVFKPLSHEERQKYSGVGADSKIASVAFGEDGIADILYGFSSEADQWLVSIHASSADGSDPFDLSRFVDTLERAESLAKFTLQFVSTNALFDAAEFQASLKKFGFDII